MTALRLARLDRVAGLVVLGVEGRRPASARSAARAVADLVRGLGDGGGDVAAAPPGPVGPRGVRLIPAHPIGPLAGPARPPPGTLMPSSTVVNCGGSPRCPAVMTIDSGFCRCSHARWILVDRPRGTGPAHDRQARRDRPRLAVPAARRRHAGRRRRADTPGRPWNPR